MSFFFPFLSFLHIWELEIFSPMQEKAASHLSVFSRPLAIVLYLLQNGTKVKIPLCLQKWCTR